MQTLYLFFGTSLRLESIFLSYLDIENYRLAHISTLTFDFHKMHWFIQHPCMCRSRKTIYLFFGTSLRLESIFLSYLDIENYRLAHISTLTFDFHKMHWFIQHPCMCRSRKTIYLFFGTSLRLESIFLSYLDIENYRLAHISTLTFDFHKMHWFYRCTFHADPLSIFWHISKTREYFFIISRHRELSIGTYFNTDLWLSQNALVLQVHLSCRPFIYFLAHL